MQSKLMVPLIIGALVVGGGSFYGGMQYATSKANVAQAATRGARGSFGGGLVVKDEAERAALPPVQSFQKTPPVLPYKCATAVPRSSSTRRRPGSEK